MKQSAGILVYRIKNDRAEVFLVHPGGPFWAKKDDAAWSIPKGEYEASEEPLAAARREFREETGSEIDGDFVALTPRMQNAGKMVRAWMVRGDLDPTTIRSNEFEMEWPPRSGQMKSFPEVDRGEWFSMETAAKKILPGQRALLEELSELLSAKEKTRQKPG
jgi:predicted NUDIX family NTP pyrophosphohydrolase